VQTDRQRLEALLNVEVKGFISGKVGTGPEYRSIDNLLTRNTKVILRKEDTQDPAIQVT
jgi:hypothetical protein